MSHILATGLQIKTEIKKGREMERDMEREMKIEGRMNIEQADLIRYSFIPQIVFNYLNSAIYR